MVIDIDTVRYVAELARLHLEEKDIEYFTGQLARILEYVEKIKKLDVEKVSPTSHPLSLKNIFREDKVMPSLSPEEATANAPFKSGNLFVVPRIIE